MARKNNRKRPAPSKKKAGALSVPAPPSPLTTTGPAKGRIRRTGERFLDSAIDTALESLWLSIYLVLGGMAMTALVTLILFLRAPESAWIYTLLKYALVYASGMLTLLLAIIGFALLGVRRRRLLEKKNSQRFKSAEKGYLDHWFHFTESNKRFMSVLSDIGTEMGRIGTCAGEIGRKLVAANNDPKRAYDIVTKGAAALDKYAAEMERSIISLQAQTSLLLESTMALATSASPASEGDPERLESSREACEGLLQRTDIAITSVKTFRQTAVSALGISQDTNSAMNRIIFGLDSITDLLSEAERKWKETVAVLNRKLAS